MIGDTKTVKQGDAYPAGTNAALSWESDTWNAYLGKVARIYINTPTLFSKVLTVSSLGTLGARFLLSLTSAETALFPVGEYEYEIRVTMTVGSYASPVVRGRLIVTEKLW
jgi:hypothetical protein